MLLDILYLCSFITLVLGYKKNFKYNFLKTILRAGEIPLQKTTEYINSKLEKEY